MKKTIPAVKLSPHYIFPFLDMIDRYKLNPFRMRGEIVSYYRNHSTRVKAPSEKNIIRAVTFPSLRHIDLIEGVWPKIILNPNGVEVLNSYRNRGLAAAKRKLGFVVYRVDRRTSSLVEILKELAKKSEIVQFSSLVETLKNRWSIKKDKDKRVLVDRLKRWLLYLAYVNFVGYKGNYIMIQKPIIESAAKGESLDLSTSMFTRILLKEYERLLKKKGGGSPYVSIPELRDVVCKEIPGMLKDEFYDYFRSIKFATNKYSIMLSEPMLRREGGIRIGNKYYYYVSIYKRR